MTISHILAEFGNSIPAKMLEDDQNGQATQELVFLEGFEKGYSDGWDDSAKAYEENIVSNSATLDSFLQNVSFTYEEAKDGVLSDLAPLFHQAIENVLTDAQKISFLPFVVQTIEGLFSGIPAPQIIVSLNNKHINALRALFSQNGGVSLTVNEDPTLDENMALIKMGHDEVEIDFDGYVTQVTSAISSFLTIHQDESQYGQKQVS